MPGSSGAIGTILLGICLSASAMAQTGLVNHHLRVLAASCAACHGYEGISRGEIPDLAGISATRFLQKMQEYREMTDDGSVMNQHAKGLTQEEISGLAVYFSGIPVAESQQKGINAQ